MTNLTPRHAPWDSWLTQGDSDSDDVQPHDAEEEFAEAMSESKKNQNDVPSEAMTRRTSTTFVGGAPKGKQTADKHGAQNKTQTVDKEVKPRKRRNVVTDVAADKSSDPTKPVRKQEPWQMYLAEHLGLAKGLYHDIKPHGRMKKLAENFKKEQSEKAK